MAKNDSTIIKPSLEPAKRWELHDLLAEAKGAFMEVAAISCLRLRANNGGNFTNEFWQVLYKDTPWDPGHEYFLPPGESLEKLYYELPSALEESLNILIHRLAATGWRKLDKADELVRNSQPFAHDPKALWKQLEALVAVADDPLKVKEWAGKIHDELGKCEVC
ncbi:MAG: hypothetical protein FJ134_13145 [Deltaproteobacteria bacterium]|nr:hypothetical protein [Deltaproteobacteria bacterium]